MDDDPDDTDTVVVRSRSHRFSKALVSVSIVASLAGTSRSADAEWAFSGYLGASFTRTSEVTLNEPDIPSLSFQDVSWASESFKTPPYYGLRLARFLESAPNWGIALDFTHAKAIAELEGAASDTFSNLEFSHGHNLLTLNGIYRWRPDVGRFQPYVGLGGGVAFPHVEVSTAESRTEAYRLTGPALQALAGVSFDLIEHLALATEYKLGYARIDAKLTGGGTLATHLLTHQVTFGLSVKF